MSDDDQQLPTEYCWRSNMIFFVGKKKDKTAEYYKTFALFCSSLCVNRSAEALACDGRMSSERK